MTATTAATQPIDLVNFYRFSPLPDQEGVRETLLVKGRELGLIGSILVGPDGLNAALSGEREKMLEFIDWLQSSDERFANLDVKWSKGRTRPYKNFYVKLKPTIINFGDNDDLTIEEILAGPRVSAKQLHAWMGEAERGERELVMIDTRNWYETDYGKFAGAETLPIHNFHEFKEAFVERFKDRRDATYIFYCTGGIRCEKVAPWAVQAGFPNSYQLDRGIFGWFEECGGDYWEGDCFVFDHRWVIGTDLRETEQQDQNMRIQPKPLVAGTERMQGGAQR